MSGFEHQTSRLELTTRPTVLQPLPNKLLNFDFAIRNETIWFLAIQVDNNFYRGRLNLSFEQKIFFSQEQFF